MISERLLLAFAGGLAVLTPVYAQLHDPHKMTCTAARGMLVPNCNGAICNQGRVTGDLKGSFTSNRTSIYRDGSGWLYSSWTRIQLDDGLGVIETVDEGTLAADANGLPDFSQAAQVMVLSEAKGKYQEYAGTFLMNGGHLVGQATPYNGRLCWRLPPRS